MDLEGELIMNTNVALKQQDDYFLTNAGKLESILPPDLFKQSFLGEWKLSGYNETEHAPSLFGLISNEPKLAKFFQAAEKKPMQVRMEMKFINFKSVGREKTVFKKIVDLLTHPD